jgi:hypothetical protein
MTLRSPSRISSILPSGLPVRSRATGPCFRTTSLEVLAPLRRSQHEEYTSRSLDPVRASASVRRYDRDHTVSPTRRRRSGIWGPRRGLPHPLRSAFAVSHDLDGLLLLVPCDVFQPLTPMGFAIPVPRAALGRVASPRLSVPPGGCWRGGDRPRVSGLRGMGRDRSVWCAVDSRDALLPAEANKPCSAASGHRAGRRFGSEDPSLELVRYGYAR